MTAAILGATGYAGSLLVSLLLEHPEVDELVAVSRSRAGARLQDAVPGFTAPGSKLGDGKLATIEEAAARRPQVVFSALPQLESAKAAAPFYADAVVIDLSADFRFADADRFAAAYGEPPPRVDLLPAAVYGLCEWHGERLRTASIIANPGCYPTAVLLPLLPLARAGLLQGVIVANAMSGVTGAGRKVSEQYLFTELSESVNAYAPGREHRHQPEIAAQLADAGDELEVVFTPHLVPMRRGLAATTVVRLADAAGEPQVAAALEQAYGAAPFIKLTPARIPTTADVWGSNRCDIGWRVSGRELLLFSAIDNLVKGAAGQAIQNMNLRFGYAETAGLPLHRQS